jgi:phenylacetic acid degradation operon negative regulatory protein
MQLRNEAAARQLTARSVIASTLLGTDPPVLSGRILVRAAALFGITEGAARVALSRMVGTGELATEDAHYRLTGTRLLERQARQATSRAATTRTWRGRWVLAIVIAERRDAADRAELREQLTAARLAELREGVWARPENLDVIWPAVVTEHCTIVAGAEVDPALARVLWDLDAWSAQANDLRRAMTELVRPLDRGETSALAPGFITSAAVLRHLQADPLLPEELLPSRWPGVAVREEYDRFDAAYRSVLRDWFRSIR